VVDGTNSTVLSLTLIVAADPVAVAIPLLRQIRVIEILELPWLEKVGA